MADRSVVHYQIGQAATSTKTDLPEPSYASRGIVHVGGRGPENTRYRVGYLRTFAGGQQVLTKREGLSDRDRWRLNKALDLCGTLAGDRRPRAACIAGPDGAGSDAGSKRKRGAWTRGTRPALAGRDPWHREEGVTMRAESQ